MAALTSEKFRIDHLDCAVCAAKLEDGLKKVEGVQHVALNFANLTLHVRAADMQKVLAEVRRLEPEVSLVSQKAGQTANPAGTQADAFRLKRELAILAAAGILFLPLLFFEGRLHRADVWGLEITLVLGAYFLAGWNVVLGALRTLRRRVFFDENVLMVIATGGALAIHAYAEAVGVMLFFKVGELLQGLAVSRSRRSIRALLSAKPDRAALKTAEGFIEVMPEAVNIGETILVKPGEKVPLDGEILSGTSQLDSSALTGEFRPIKAGPGDAVLAGQINQTGALTVRVSRLFEASSIARIMDLVENASARKANPEKFITTFARYYTPAVVLIAAAVALIPPLLLPEASFQRWIYRALVLLVISCPCALMVSIPLGYFAGIGRASRSGILVKGANFLDALAAVKTVVFDKTGTLTRAVFEVKEVVSHNGFSKEQLLEYAAAAEHQSTHPIATAITGAYERLGHRIETAEIAQHTEIAGQGVLARYGVHDVLVGNDGLLHRGEIPHTICTVEGTVAHVAVDGEYAGYLIIGDEVRAEAAATITALRDQGVEHLAMLTGDNECAAEAVARQLKLDGWHAHLLPEDKVDVFERIKAARRNDGKMVFVGDGINDAPVLARADVGVAMGALGSDAAIETADVVLMTNALTKMAEAVAIAKHTRSIVWQNIGVVFVIKAIFIAMGAMGLATMWEAVFADMGTALLAVANSTRVLGKTPTPRTMR